MITLVCGLVRGYFPTQRLQRGNNHSRRLAGREGGREGVKQGGSQAGQQASRELGREAGRHSPAAPRELPGFACAVRPKLPLPACALSHL